MLHHDRPGNSLVWHDEAAPRTLLIRFGVGLATAALCGLLVGCERQTAPNPPIVLAAVQAPEPPALRSENPAEVELAAVALAAACTGENTATNLALMARGASLTLRPDPLFQPAWNGLAQAVRRCAPQPALLLGAWLNGGAQARAAASRALAGLSVETQLSSSVLEAMLDTDPANQTSLFFALAQSATIAPTLARAAMPLALAARDDFWATRALRHAGPNGSDVLLGRIRNTELSERTRRVALHTWLELAEPGPRDLAALVLEQAPLALLRDLLRAFGSALPTGGNEGWRSPALRARLAALAALPLEPPAERQVRIDIRCEAAALLSGDAEAPTLLGCDPDLSTALALAQLRVAARSEGTTGSVWEGLAENHEPDFEQALLRTLAARPPSPLFERTLAAALRSETSGTVEVAAELISHAARSDSDYKLSPGVFSALRDVLARATGELSITAQAALIDAAAASRALSLRQHLPPLCDSPHAAVRRSVNAALNQLRTTDCAPRAHEAQADPILSPPATAQTAQSKVLRFTFERGVRTITFEPDAPASQIALIERWIREKRLSDFAELAILDDHMVLLGASRDGHHGPVLPLADAPHPSHFAALSVALRKQGAGAYDQQLVVLLAPRPDLDNDWERIGSAGAEWTDAAVGEKLLGVEWANAAP